MAKAETLQQEKVKLAEGYVESFKKELTDFQVSVFSRFQDKIQGLILSTEPLGDSIDDLPLTDEEKKFLNADPAIAQKLFDFIKDKNTALTTANTEEDLQKLSAEMKLSLSEPEGGKRSALKEGAITSGAGAGTVMGTSKIADRANIGRTKKTKALFEGSVKETMIESKNAKEIFGNMEKQFSDLSKEMTVWSKNPKLTNMMKRNLMKSAKVFEDTAKNMDDQTISAFEMRSSLKDKLPYSVIKSIKPAQAAELMNIANNAKDIEEVRTLLKIKGLNEETIQVLKSAKNLDEFKGIVFCLEKAKSLRSVLKGIRGVVVLDVIMLGVDVRMYEETMNQIDETKKINEIRGNCAENKANRQLAIGVAGTAASIAVTIIVSCTAIGSIIPGFGTIIGLAVGAIAAGAYQIVESHYETVDFYAQNEEDYKRKYKTEIKQAIIQTTSAEAFGRHTGIRSDIALERKQDGKPIEIVQDARSALIRQEEMDSGSYPLLQQWQNSGKPESEFKSSLSAEDMKSYEEQSKKIYAIVDKRLEYIRQYMYENKNTQQMESFIKAMKGAQGLSFVDRIVAQSKVYYLKSDQSQDQYLPGFENKTVDEYIKAYGEKLQKEDPVLFEKLSAIAKKDMTRFVEIYQGSIYRENINQASTTTSTVPSETAPIVSEEKTSSETETKTETETGTEEAALGEQEKTVIREHIAYIKKFYQFVGLGIPVEQMNALKLNFLDVDYNYVESFLKDIEKVNAPSVFSSTDVKLYLTGDALVNRAQSNIEVSDRIGQNVLYRLAKEMHGYTGDNDMMQLMNFYAPGKENSTGLYYDGGRYINNDRAIDKSFDLAIFDDPKKSTEDIMKELIDAKTRQNYALMVLVPNPTALVGSLPVFDVRGFTNNASSIDTPTENMDDEMNAEFRSRFKKIVEEEKGYIGKENKQTVEKEIVDFVQQGIKNQITTNESGYVEIPYYLVIKAKKAGIGDLSKFLFSRKDGKLVACGNKAYVDVPLDFSLTKTIVSKEFVGNMREGFTPEEQKYIDYVEQAHNRLEELRNIKGVGSHEDELDLPKDFEIIISDKRKEREKLKKAMLSCDPAIAIPDMLKAQYQGYHDYFENMYMAILVEVSSHDFSNDIDGYSYIMSVMDKMQRGFFDLENKTLLAGILTEKESIAFYKIIANQKIFGKTIAELVKSSDLDEQRKGYRGAKQVLKTFLELKTLHLNDSFGIEEIYSGEYSINPFPFVGMTESIERIQGYQKSRQLLIYNLDEKKFFTPPDINSRDIKTTPVEDLKISSVSGKDTQAMDASKKITKAIEATLADVVWQGKRGELNFDPEKKTLASRSKSIEIDPATLKIKGLNVIFKNLEELVYTANLINRIHYKYPGVKDFEFRAFKGTTRMGGRLGGRGIYHGSTRVLELDTIKEKFPSLLNADNNVKDEFISYINSAT